MTAEDKDKDLLAAKLAAFEKAAAARAPAEDPDEALPEGIEPEDEEAPEAAEDTPAAEEEVQHDPDEETEPEVDDDALRRATAALLRSGFDQEEISKMPVERRLERGLRRAEILARDDDAHRRVREALEPGPKETAPKSAEPASKPEQAGVPAVDYEAVVAPFAEQYGLDEDGKKALAGAFAQAVGPLAEDVRSLKSARQSEVEREVEALVSSARSEVAKEFPAVKDDSTFTKVVEEMVLLQNAQRFQKIDDPGKRARAVMQAAAASLGIERATEKNEVTATPRTVRRVPAEPERAQKPEGQELSPREQKWRVFNDVAKKHRGQSAAAG